MSTFIWIVISLILVIVAYNNGKSDGVKKGYTKGHRDGLDEGFQGGQDFARFQFMTEEDCDCPDCTLERQQEADAKAKAEKKASRAKKAPKAKVAAKKKSK